MMRWASGGLSGFRLARGFLGVVGSIPLEGPPQAFLEENGWLVAEDFPRAADFRLGVADIAIARRFVFGLEILPGDFSQQIKGMIQRNAGAGTNVKDFSECAGGFAGEEIGLDGVFDKGEVAGLLAVAIDERLTVLEEGGSEAGKYAGIGRIRVLPRAEDVEVPERNALEAVTALESLRVKLTHVFRDAIGRDRGGLHVFRLGKRGGLAVGRRGGGEDDALDFIVAGGQQDIQGAVDVDAVGIERILDRARNRGASGQVNHEFGLQHGLLHGLQIGDGALHEGDFVANFGEILLFAGRKIVKHDDAVTSPDELLHRVGADKSGAPRDQVAHVRWPPAGKADLLYDDWKESKG